MPNETIVFFRAVDSNLMLGVCIHFMLDVNNSGPRRPLILSATGVRETKYNPCFNL